MNGQDDMNFKAFKNKIVWGVLSAGLLLHVTWVGWVSVRSFNQPTYDQMNVAIVEKAPYTKEQKRIDLQLDNYGKLYEKMIQSFDNNTAAIQELRVELAKIRASQTSR